MRRRGRVRRHHAALALACGALLALAACSRQSHIPGVRVAAAGDISCDPGSTYFDGTDPWRCQMRATAALVEAFRPEAVLALGDEQYEDATLAKFQQSYARSWGVPATLQVTHPVPGDHEYDDPDPARDANGYFSYFGAAAGDPTGGYYSFDVGDWHMIALNTNCAKVGGCQDGSPQGEWLEDDLQANGSLCTLAYFHFPLFSSGDVGPADQIRPLWRLLYTSGVDVILNGHSHDYERFAPMDPDGDIDRVRGIREFIVGTGGKSHRSLHDGDILPQSQAHNDNSYGVLYLWLRPTGYSWSFQPVPGADFTDWGSDSCH